MAGFRCGSAIMKIQAPCLDWFETGSAFPLIDGAILAIPWNGLDRKDTVDRLEDRMGD